MRALIIIILATQILAATTSFASGNFQYDTSDRIETSALDYELFINFAISDRNPNRDPSLSYYTDHRVYGINQDRFEVVEERYQGNVPREAYEDLLEAATKLSTSTLIAPPDSGPAQVRGWLEINGERFRIKAPPNSAIRLQWRKLIDEFLAEHVPAKHRRRATRTLEGETVAPTDVDFPTLLASPQAFDGKRIRITGYYHNEFEGSSFAATPADIDNYDEAIWLGGNSTFADPGRFDRGNNVTATVEGTFNIGPGGHMGLWMGELNRLTRFEFIHDTKGNKRRILRKPINRRP